MAEGIVEGIVEAALEEDKISEDSDSAAAKKIVT